MKNNIVKAYAPATIANVTAGFDVLGIALETPGDFVTARRIESSELVFSVETHIKNIPKFKENNVAAHVVSEMLQVLKPKFGVEIILHKKMPVGSGLGSSGASSVAAAMAFNALLDKPLSKMELLPFVVEGERKASGAAHADNVAPSLLGGATIIRNENPIDVIPFAVHPSITWVVIHPHMKIATMDARRLLPETIGMRDVIRQMGNISGLIQGLMQGDASIIARSMVDHIAEPIRCSFIPAFAEMKQAAIDAGAMGCGISGSGPSLFALTLHQQEAQKIANAMTKALLEFGKLTADIIISRTNTEGAKLIAEDTHAI